jgi:hypothetical protein
MEQLTRSEIKAAVRVRSLAHCFPASCSPAAPRPQRRSTCCLYSGPLTAIRGPDEAIARCVHSASRRPWCPWFPCHVSTRISDCPPPFVHSMNVSGNSLSTRDERGVPAHVEDVPMDVGGDLDAPVKLHYPVISPTSASRGLSLANLVLSRKTATARTASAVSRPTMMFLVNPRRMKPAKDATAQTSA